MIGINEIKVMNRKQLLSLAKTTFITNHKNDSNWF